MTEQLSEEEVERLRKLLEVADEVYEQTQYKMAKKLLFNTWRQSIVAIASVVSAFLVIWAFGRDFIKGIFGG